MRRMLLLLPLLVATTSAQKPAADRFYQVIRNDERAAVDALVSDAGLDARDAQGHTPLMFAAAFGSLETMRLLLAAGADARAANGTGTTALHLSAGDAAKVRLLLDRGADVHARSQAGRTPLLVAASHHGAVDAVRLLLAAGAEVQVADTAGVTPLLAAATVDDAQTARLLLDHGADVNARPAAIGQSATPLMAAAYNGSAELARVLLGRQADVAAVSANRSGTAKNGAVLFGNVTALHMGVAGGNVGVVRMLLDAGAKVDPLDVRGMTPLMWAAATDRPVPAILRLLLARGASPATRSALGETTLDWARKFNNPAVLAALGQRAAPAGPAAAETPTPPRVSARAAVERSLPLLRTAAGAIV